MRGLALLLLCALLPSCVVTADENLWKATKDAAGSERRAPDRPAPAPDRAAAGESRADRPAADRREVQADSKPDSKPDCKPDFKLKPDLSCKQLVLTVNAPGDDGTIWGTLFGPNGDDEDHLLWMGAGTNNPSWGYFRFTLTSAIPAGAVIGSVTLSLWSVDSDVWASGAALDVFLENSADAAVVTAASQAPFASSGRPVTNMLRWPPSGGLAWTPGKYNNTPNLAPLLQALVSSKNGLAAGAHVQLWVRGAQLTDGAVATADFSLPGYSSGPHRLAVDLCN